MPSKRKAADKLVSVVEHVPAPDADPRLARAFDLILRAARARAGGEVPEGRASEEAGQEGISTEGGEDA